MTKCHEKIRRFVIKICHFFGKKVLVHTLIKREYQPFIHKKTSNMNQFAKIRPFAATKIMSNGLLDEFFNRSMSELVGSDYAVNQPAVNIVESKDAFRLEFAAPGFDKQDFSLSTENNYLTVEAKKETRNENSDERYTRREFRYESFKRSYKLPETVNQDAISAVYENGILVVTLQKKEEVKPIVKTIAIG